MKNLRYVAFSLVVLIGATGQRVEATGSAKLSSGRDRLAGSSQIQKQTVLVPRASGIHGDDVARPQDALLLRDDVLVADRAVADRAAARLDDVASSVVSGSEPEVISTQGQSWLGRQKEAAKEFFTVDRTDGIFSSVIPSAKRVDAWQDSANSALTRFKEGAQTVGDAIVSPATRSRIEAAGLDVAAKLRYEGNDQGDAAQVLRDQATSAREQADQGPRVFDNVRKFGETTAQTWRDGAEGRADAWREVKGFGAKAVDAMTPRMLSLYKTRKAAERDVLANNSQPSDNKAKIDAIQRLNNAQAAEKNHRLFQDTKAGLTAAGNAVKGYFTPGERAKSLAQEAGLRVQQGLARITPERLTTKFGLSNSTQLGSAAENAATERGNLTSATPRLFNQTRTGVEAAGSAIKSGAEAAGTAIRTGAQQAGRRIKDSTVGQAVIQQMSINPEGKVGKALGKLKETPGAITKFLKNLEPKRMRVNREIKALEKNTSLTGDQEKKLSALTKEKEDLGTMAEGARAMLTALGGKVTDAAKSIRTKMTGQKATVDLPAVVPEALADRV